jgi:hypothetical protein
VPANEALAVAPLALNGREIRESLRACAHIRVPDPAPLYMQQFLARRVEGLHPALADKVFHLPPDSCAELFRLIRALQRNGREE